MPCLGQEDKTIPCPCGTSPARPYKGLHASTDTKNAFISFKKVQLDCHKQVFPKLKRITELPLLLKISYKRQLHAKLHFKIRHLVHPYK